MMVHVLGIFSAIFVFSALAEAGKAESLVLVGRETRSILFTDVYRLSVFTEDGVLNEADLASPGRSMRLLVEIIYTGDMPGMPESWTDELAPATTALQMAKMTEKYRRLGDGDAIVMSYEPEHGSILAINGEPVIYGPGDELMNAALQIWFGDTPVSAAIKSSILTE